MKRYPAFRSTAGALLSASLLAASLAACSSGPEFANVPALAPSHTVEQANQRIAAVAKERAAIEARFAERERACYEKFFVNHCLDDAKERRRSALAAQRAIEIEASHFLRQAKVDERERAMAEAEARYKIEEEELARQPAPAPAPRDTSETPPPRPSPVAGRMARHNAKVKEAEAKDRAEADQRAANVAAYNKRKAEAEARQRKVAERKAEKAAKEAKAQQASPNTPAEPATPATPPAQ